jgi:myo-inositol-1(or 4)-monophosphatase
MSQLFLTIAERAARAGGAILLEYQHRITGREKGPRDLVTEADLASQRCIREILHAEFAEHDFLGEEDDPHAPPATGRDYRWIVDPLDGTLNYVHGLQAYAVSIALEHCGEIIAGAIFDPILDECYAAAKDAGAWLNGNPIKTSGCQKAEAALVAASFSPLVDPDSLEVKRFIAALEACQGVRRLGSAALNLAYVAAGRLDAYWATSVKIWDVAAGVLLVREAGGLVTHVAGGELDLKTPELLASASEALKRELTSILNP